MDETRDQELIRLSRELELRFAQRRAALRTVARLDARVREIKGFMRGLTSLTPPRKRKPVTKADRGSS